MVVYGTRPELIKLAPVILGLRDSPLFDTEVVSTGQHAHMLAQVEGVFGIRPDVDLQLMTHGQSLGRVTSEVTAALDSILAERVPDCLLVQGDTTTVAAAALAAFNRQVPVVHLEAGLRSHDLASPFPEEGNRRIVSQIAALHLAPTADAAGNLLAEGISARDICVTGNTVTDALLWAGRRDTALSDPTLAAIVDGDRPLVLFTAHRRENIGEPMRGIARAIRRIALDHPDHTIIWPAHKNPTVRVLLRPQLTDLPNVVVTEPLDYLELVRVMHRARLVITDSGGIQEEAPTLGVPVLVLRETTERPEGVDAGVVALIGTDADKIVSATRHLLEDPAAHAEMAQAVSPYGDGRCAPRCVDAIGVMLGLPTTTLATGAGYVA